MQPSHIPISPDVIDYITLNGFKRLNDNITSQTVLVRGGKEAIVISGISITYKQNIHTYPADAATVLYKWATVKKYTGFDGKDMSNLIMMLHVMGVIRIQDANREAKQHVRNHMLTQMMAMHTKQPETAQA